MTTTKKLSPRGMLLKGGIYTYIAPRLAQDAKIDIDAILLGAPTTNRITQRAAIVSALRTAASGKLAQDADLDDVAEVLEAIEHLHEEEEGDDMEPNSAMPIVQREAGEDDMPPEAHEFLKSKLHPDDHARLMELMHAEAEDWDDEDAMDARRARRADDARRRLGRDESEKERREREDREGGEDRTRADDARRARDTKRADDAKRRLGRDETPEECAERMRGAEAADRKRAADRKHARDAKRADDARRADDKRAMDAAIATERSNQRAIREAERNVRPYIGELPATLAADSADEVYRHALTALGVKTDGVHPSAYRTILELQPRTGARSAAPRLAADAAGQKSFAERYPQAARISHI